MYSCFVGQKLTVLLIVTTMLLTMGISTSAKPTKLTFLTEGSESYIEATRQFINEFEKRYPDIEIELQLGGWNKLKVMIAAGLTPDLGRFISPNVLQFAYNGLLMSLDNFVAASEKVDIDDFVPALKKSLMYNSQLYAIPFGVNVATVFYNKDHFNEAGIEYPNKAWDWETDVISAGKRMSFDKDNDGIYERFFSRRIGYGEFYFMTRAAGGRLFDDTGTTFLGNSEASIKALNFMTSLWFEHQIMPLPNEPGGPWEFPSGTTSFLMGESWYTTHMQQARVPFDWDVAVIPKFCGHNAAWIEAETPIGIPVSADYPELSWKFLEFVGSSEGQKILMKLGLAMPPMRLSVARDLFEDMYPFLNTQAFLTNLTAPYSRPAPCLPTFDCVRFTLYHALDSVLNGDEPAETALAEAERLINNQLAQFK